MKKFLARLILVIMFIVVYLGPLGLVVALNVIAPPAFQIAPVWNVFAGIIDIFCGLIVVVLIGVGVVIRSLDLIDWAERQLRDNRRYGD